MQTCAKLNQRPYNKGTFQYDKPHSYLPWQQSHCMAVLFLIVLVVPDFHSRFVLPALQLKSRMGKIMNQLERMQAVTKNGAIGLDKLRSEVMTEPSMAHLWA